jgi:DNA-directed RNA polymerase specialized sigma24 family protein
MSFVERIYRLVAREVERAPAGTVPAIPPLRLKESAAARAALARAAVAALPPGERSAFLLTRVAKLPVPLAATASGASEAELRRRLVRAFTLLASSLAPLVSPAAAPQPPTTGTEAAS